jgi:hypothetical protein
LIATGGGDGPGDPTGQRWSNLTAATRGDGGGWQRSLAILAAASGLRISISMRRLCGPCGANREKWVAPLGRSAHAGLVAAQSRFVAQARPAG